MTDSSGKLDIALINLINLAPNGRRGRNGTACGRTSDRYRDIALTSVGLPMPETAPPASLSAIRLQKSRTMRGRRVPAGCVAHVCCKRPTGEVPPLLAGRSPF